MIRRLKSAIQPTIQNILKDYGPPSTGLMRAEFNIEVYGLRAECGSTPNAR